MSKEPKLSPVFQEYVNLKEKHQDCIIFYRMGDFYEIFFEDAELVSKLLELTLTSKSCGLPVKAPMCGVPYHSVDGYIAKLVKLGYKVAICEQIGEVTKGKLVDRDIVRIITAGTVTSDTILENNKNNYLFCVNKYDNKIGVAYTDITTGDFYAGEYNEKEVNKINDILFAVEPAEIIGNSLAKTFIQALPSAKALDFPTIDVCLEEKFSLSYAKEVLSKQFNDNFEKIFELENNPVCVGACGALISYLIETQKSLLMQINKIKKVNIEDYMIIDATARKNLEITETLRHRGKKGTLLHIMDNTQTSMGARQLRVWLEQPLKNTKEINLRLDSVEELYSNLIFRDGIIQLLKNFCDIERLTSKIGMKTVLPKDLINLSNSIMVLPAIKKALANVKSTKLKELNNKIDGLEDLYSMISQTIKEEPSNLLKDGGFIKSGFNEELDRLRAFAERGRQNIMDLQIKERETTGIESLKIKYNNVYGYFIEISRELSNKVPLTYHRKQTVADSDRYFTEELKNMEEQLGSANQDIINLEQKIFNFLREKLLDYIEKLQETSKAISELDCLASFASIAVKYNYVRPVINDNIKQISINEGRHPVVENNLKAHEFIANNTLLNQTTDKIMIITGPNMAGKSTYMRQVAIITLMAHLGSFVPAKSAEISITDRIFTRVGASDDLSFGQSTFMVEMTELAHILNNTTDKSLIILDEIGRGTSTFDGLSIAWSVVEFLSNLSKAKVLFATHYHELTELEGLIPGVKNYKINVKEFNNSIIFLRKIVRGGANKSFGIEVASLAGIPKLVIDRAKEISKNIEQQNIKLNVEQNMTENNNMLENNEKIKQVANLLKDLNIERLSPMDAFSILSDILEKIK